MFLHKRTINFLYVSSRFCLRERLIRLLDHGWLFAGLGLLLDMSRVACGSTQSPHRTERRNFRAGRRVRVDTARGVRFER